MLNAKGEPNNRTNEYAKLLNAQGWHVVYIDSFTARGVKSVATMVFYPGCGKRSVEQQCLPQWPVTMFLGAADDWTDPVPCQQIATKLGLTAHTYPNAFHGFDSDAPVVQLKSITSSMTGQGVHLGGNAAAKTAAQAALIAALKHAFK
jgi:dienelactone hydrolase